MYGRRPPELEKPIQYLVADTQDLWFCHLYLNPVVKGKMLTEVLPLGEILAGSKT